MYRVTGKRELSGHTFRPVILSQRRRALQVLSYGWLAVAPQRLFLHQARKRRAEFEALLEQSDLSNGLLSTQTA